MFADADARDDRRDRAEFAAILGRSVGLGVPRLVMAHAAPAVEHDAGALALARLVGGVQERGQREPEAAKRQLEKVTAIQRGVRHEISGMEKKAGRFDYGR